MVDSSRFAGRSIHGVPRFAQALAARPTIRVAGLVAEPRELTPEDLTGLQRIDYLEARRGVEGGTVPDLPWSGVRLADAVALARPLAGARFVRVSGGPYGLPLSLAEAEIALLCDRLGDAPLAAEQGGPWRLVVPGGRFGFSIKWIDRLELTAEPGDNPAERIALARARARDAKRERGD